MIDELVTRGLPRIYAVDDVEYLEILDWRQIQRVGKRARRRYPGDSSRPDPVPEPAAAVAPSEPSSHTGVPGVSLLVATWRQSVGLALRGFLPNGPPADTEVWIDRWIADGCDLRRGGGMSARQCVNVFASATS